MFVKGMDEASLRVSMERILGECSYQSRLNQLIRWAQEGKDTGYLMALIASELILRKHAALFGKIRGFFTNKRECRIAIMRGYSDFALYRPVEPSLSIEQARSYRLIAENAADLLMAHRSVQIEDIIHIARCLPNCRRDAIDAAATRFGEQGVRQILWNFRRYNLIITQKKALVGCWPRKCQGLFLESEPDTSWLAAKWLLKNGKTQKAFGLIYDYVPEFRDEAQEKIDAIGGSY